MAAGSGPPVLPIFQLSSSEIEARLPVIRLTGLQPAAGPKAMEGPLHKTPSPL
jgi:hypothetical protein